jgi:hypothetical protein
MTASLWLKAGAAVAVLVVLAWGATRLLERVIDPPVEPIGAPSTAPPAAETAAETAHIRATLFVGSSDGTSLAQVQREVPLAADPVAQGRQILLALLQPAPAPYVSLIPAGTMLRAFYIADGDAFVDLSVEASSAHPGGSFTELLTVQAIVQTVTSNLRSARRVQILIDGNEVDTLAGHVDLRRPLAADPSVIAAN